MSRDQRGFTLIETLVVVGLLSVVSVGFYQVLVSGTRGTDTTRSVVRVSEEARLGLNRMIRDTREATGFTATTATSYTIEVDFDRDGSPEPSPGPGEDQEVITFAYNAGSGTITLNGEVLVAGVAQIGTEPMFSYTSNRLEFDADLNGVTDASEIDTAVGNANGVIDLASERALITGVAYALEITSDDSVTEFYAETQLRNKR